MARTLAEVERDLMTMQEAVQEALDDLVAAQARVAELSIEREALLAAATPSPAEGPSIQPGSFVEWLPGDGEAHDFGTVRAVLYDGAPGGPGFDPKVAPVVGYSVLWTGDVTPRFVAADEVGLATDSVETFTRV